MRRHAWRSTLIDGNQLERVILLIAFDHQPIARWKNKQTCCSETVLCGSKTPIKVESQNGTLRRVSQLMAALYLLHVQSAGSEARSGSPATAICWIIALECVVHVTSV